MIPHFAAMPGRVVANDEDFALVGVVVLIGQLLHLVIPVFKTGQPGGIISKFEADPLQPETTHPVINSPPSGAQVNLSDSPDERKVAFTHKPSGCAISSMLIAPKSQFGLIAVPCNTKPAGTTGRVSGQVVTEQCPPEQLQLDGEHCKPLFGPPTTTNRTIVPLQN